jgi:hypothetical protein
VVTYRYAEVRKVNLAIKPIGCWNADVIELHRMCSLQRQGQRWVVSRRRNSATQSKIGNDLTLPSLGLNELLGGIAARSQWRCPPKILASKIGT